MKFLSIDEFARHLNETFVASYSDSDVNFVLVEVQPLAAPLITAGAVRQPFSLIFRNENMLLFPQQIYTMRHSTMGQMGIFLVPVARDQSGFLYQAIFN